MKPLDHRALSIFCREFSQLCHAGILPSEGFMLLAEQEPDPGFRRLLQEMYQAADQGAATHQALAAAGIFPEYMLRMVRLGEQTGALEAVFAALAAYYHRQARLRRALRAAVAYPLLLLGIVLAVFFVFLAEVLPIFQNVYTQIGVSMGGFALAFLRFGQWLAAARWPLLGLILLLALVVALFCRLPALRRLAGAWFANSRVGQAVAAARVSAALSLSMSGTRDVDEALGLACDFSAGFAYEPQLRRCAQLVDQGASLSAAALQTRLFPPVYCRMLAIGQHTGTLEAMLAEVARRTEEDMDDGLARLTGRVEPAAVIVLSVFVGLLLLSVMTPLVGIMAAL